MENTVLGQKAVRMDGSLGQSQDHRQIDGIERGAPEAGAEDWRWRALIDDARDALYVCALIPTRAFSYVNRGMSELTGYSPEEFYAEPELLSRIVHPDDQARLELSHLASAPEWPCVTRWRTKTDALIWTETRARSIEDAEGRIVAIQSVVRDASVWQSALNLREMAAGILAYSGVTWAPIPVGPGQGF